MILLRQNFKSHAAHLLQSHAVESNLQPCRNFAAFFMRCRRILLAQVDFIVLCCSALHCIGLWYMAGFLRLTVKYNVSFAPAGGIRTDRLPFAGRTWASCPPAPLELTKPA